VVAGAPHEPAVVAVRFAQGVSPAGTLCVDRHVWRVVGVAGQTIRRRTGGGADGLLPAGCSGVAVPRAGAKVPPGGAGGFVPEPQRGGGGSAVRLSAGQGAGALGTLAHDVATNHHGRRAKGEDVLADVKDAG